MPVAPTYPGVYIDELPSGVRTIIGVATSVAAFVGPAARGPLDVATHITSWGDFERAYGGLSTSSPMSYAVRQFYQNGGAEAEIVRVASGATPSEIDLKAGAITLAASSPGSWGDKLRARVDYDTADRTNTQLYNVTVRDPSSGAQERFLNVDATKDSTNSLERKLRDSTLVTVSKNDNSRPAESPEVLSGDPLGDNAKLGPADAGKKSYLEVTKKGKDGDPPDDDAYNGSEDDKKGIYALLKTDIFNLLVIPPNAFGDAGIVPDGVLTNATQLCVDRRAVLLLDSPPDWTTVQKAFDGVAGLADVSPNAAMFFPSITLRDAITDSDRAFGPSGSVAGVIARTDVQRGVWKAPAGLDTTIAGVKSVGVPLTDLENGRLNPRGLNCIRSFPLAGTVVWGSRTLRGADVMADQWKYLPVRRTALFIEESLYRGTKWAVFEPNDEPLWASLRLNIGAFMNSLYRLGAFAGSTPREAYLVKCDRENNPDNDINRGIVNILVGFKPLQPAEFVIIHIQQLAGQLET